MTSWRDALLPDFTPVRQPCRNWICDMLYGMIVTRVTVGHVVGIVIGIAIVYFGIQGQLGWGIP